MASKSRTGVKIFITVVILAVLAVLGVYLLRPVAKIAKVRSGTALDLVPGSVVVAAEFAMELKSENGGRVMRSELEPGKPVKKGEVLVQIDTGDLALEIERIENDYDSAKKRVAIGSQFTLDLETAKSDLENAERLHKNGNMSESDLFKQRRVVKGLEQRRDLETVANDAQIAQLENTLKTKRRQLAKMTVTAMFDGVIDKVLARPGDLIGPGSPIAIVIATTRTVEARISEESFSGVKVGQKASVRFLQHGAELYDAKIVQILPTAEADTQRYVVHLDVKIDKELLVPGITGEVTIVVNERESKTIVPRRALSGVSVWVVNKENIVEERPITRGFVALNDVEVLKGLSEGEEVIVEELDRFRPGEHVRTQLAK
jgi:RND family efflux transporter MFP subunit